MKGKFSSTQKVFFVVLTQITIKDTVLKLLNYYLDQNMDQIKNKVTDLHMQ